MEEQFSFLALVRTVLVWGGLIGLLAGFVWVAIRFSLYKAFLVDRGFGLVSCLIPLGSFVAIAWGSNLSGFAAWNAVIVILTVGAAILAFLPWGLWLSFLPAREKRDRRRALVFTLVGVSPAAVIFVWLATAG